MRPRRRSCLALALPLAVAACGSRAAPAPTIASAPRSPAAGSGVRSIVRDPAAAVTCGKLSTALAEKAPLLVDRLQIRVPAGVSLTPRPYNIMSAPTPLEEETRVMIGGGASAGAAQGDAAFVILAQETWQLDPDQAPAEADAPIRPGPLDEEARKFLRAVTGDDTLAVERARVADPAVRLYAGRPAAAAAEDGADAALLLALLVVHPDATLQTIGFYVSPELAREAGCGHFADRIADTLTIGSRKLERGGLRALHAVSPTQSLTVTLPPDYTVVHQEGPDFDNYRLLRLRPLGLFPGRATISVDTYPHRDLPPDATQEKGTLLGRPVTWHVRREAAGGVMLATQPLLPGKSPDQRFVQVTIVATRQAKFLDEFRRVVESLALGPAKPAAQP